MDFPLMAGIAVEEEEEEDGGVVVNRRSGGFDSSVCEVGNDRVIRLGVVGW